MKYINVKYEEKDNLHMLRIDIDGNVRNIAFQYKYMALDLMKRLMAYTRLIDFDNATVEKVA